MKMNKMVAAIVSGSMAVVNVFSCVGTVWAISGMELEYIEGALGRHLSDTEYASLSDVSITDSFELYNLETAQTSECNLYVVLNDNDVIGTLCVNNSDGRFSSSFDESGVSFIQDVYDDNGEIAYCCYNGEPLLFDGENFYSRRTESVVNYSFEDSEFIHTEFVEVFYDDFQLSAGSLARSTSIGSSLGGTFVPVSNQTINDVGICWAASIAVKENYENDKMMGEAGYVDALDVYYAVRQETGVLYPTGTAEMQRIGLGLYGLLDTYKSGSVSVSALMSEFANDNPVMISISGTGGSHSVVLGGIIYFDSGMVRLSFADSNFSVIKTCEFYVSDTTSNIATFEYYDSAYGFTFDNWHRTFSYRTENSYISLN